MLIFQKTEEAHQYINNRSGAFQPKFAVILGTGLSGLAKDIEVVCEIPYSEIPHFPVSTVESHASKLILGYLMEIPIIAMAGRFHYYEGYTAQEITFPVRVFKALGVQHLFISSAVGSVNEQMNAGDIVVVNDHINLLPDNPLRGPNDNRLGIRFPDMKDAYDQTLITTIQEIATEQGLNVQKAVYLALQGPNLETPAEYRFAHIIGADLVGMSTVPEVIVAKHVELPVLVMAVVSNKCYPIDSIEETTLEEVVAVVESAAHKLIRLIKAVIQELNEPSA